VNFLIADTFNDSLAKLTGEEQKAVRSFNQPNLNLSFGRHIDLQSATLLTNLSTSVSYTLA